MCQRLWLLGFLFLFATFHHARSHTFSERRECPHDEIIQNLHPPESFAPYVNHPFAPHYVPPAVYQPIRIRATYMLSSSTPAEQQHAKDLVESAIVYMQKRINVIRVSGVLRFDQICSTSTPGGCTALDNTCNDHVSGLQVQIPSLHLRGNVVISPTPLTVIPSGVGLTNADLIVYIVSNDAVCSSTVTLPSGRRLSFTSGINSWGAACRTDQYGRPTAAFINLCPGLLSRTLDFGVNIKEVVHQLFHILGFSHSLFNKFKRPDGSTRPESEIFQTEVTYNPLVGKFPAIVLPSVVSYARTYYNCPTMNGLPTEQFNMVLSGLTYEQRRFFNPVSSHWHVSWLMSETMNSRIWKMRTLSSEFTLRLLNDSGWYSIDVSGWGEPIRWGYRFGCRMNAGAFVSVVKTCVAAPIFCTEYCVRTAGCTFDGTSQGDCVAKQFGATPEPFSCNRGDEGVHGPALAGSPKDPFLLSGRVRENDFTHSCLDRRVLSNTDEFYMQEDPSILSHEGERDSRCMAFEDGFGNRDVGACSRFRCGNPDGSGYNAVTRQWNKLVAFVVELDSTNQPITEAFECNPTVLCQTRAGGVLGFGGWICPRIDSRCVGAKPFECRFGWWSDDLAKCICMAGFHGPNCDDTLKSPEQTGQTGVTVIFNPETYPQRISVSSLAMNYTDVYTNSSVDARGVRQYSDSQGGSLTFHYGNLEWKLSIPGLGDCSVIAAASGEFLVENGFSFLTYCDPSDWTGFGRDVVIRVLDAGSPSISPTRRQTNKPTQTPPSSSPTKSPSNEPSTSPTTSSPISTATGLPSSSPTRTQTGSPSASQTDSPSATQTGSPSVSQTGSPSASQTGSPSTTQSGSPSTTQTGSPTATQTGSPSVSQTDSPSTTQTGSPTTAPSSGTPSMSPSQATTRPPSSTNPTRTPTTTTGPSAGPTNQPTSSPILIGSPSGSPNTQTPTRTPFSSPSGTPTRTPIRQPSSSPIRRPSGDPSMTPSKNPTTPPIINPTRSPIIPSQSPTKYPTAPPSSRPSTGPVRRTTRAPARSTFSPTHGPTIGGGSNPGDQCRPVFCQSGGDVNAVCAGEFVKDGCVCSLGFKETMNFYCGSKSPTPARPTWKPHRKSWTCNENLCQSRGDRRAWCNNDSCKCSHMYTLTFDDRVCLRDMPRNFWKERRRWSQ